MNLWENYFKECYGSSLITEDWGFISYTFKPPYCVVENIYILPEFRQAHRASLLCDLVAQEALQNNCSHLWADIWVKNLKANEALASSLAYGFKMIASDNDRIILTKDIGGSYG